MRDSFQTRTSFGSADSSSSHFSLQALPSRFRLAHLPYTHKILLENLLRHEDGVGVTKRDIKAVAGWGPHGMGVLGWGVGASRPRRQC